MKFKSLFVTITIAVASASASSQQDVISTISGAGPSGMPAINANLNQVGQIALDAQGNYYFAAYSQNRVFKVTSAGMITVVAGNGFAGYSGDGGLAINAEFNNPIGVAVDGANPANIYISDSNNCLVRKVTASNGMVTTVAGLVNHPSPGSASPQCGYGGDGAAADAAQLNDPLGVAFNSKTNTLYIADYNNGRIRTVAGASPTSIITTVAGGGVQPTKAIPARGALPTETADRLQAHIYADLKV